MEDVKLAHEVEVRRHDLPLCLEEVEGGVHVKLEVVTQIRHAYGG